IRVVAAITSTSRRTVLWSILGHTTTTRWSYNRLGIVIDHSARDCFLNRTSTTLWITKIPARLTRHPTPWAIIMPVSPAIWIAVPRTIVAIMTGITAVTIVTVMPRTWISLVIRQWVPTNVVAKRNVEDERDECGTPPTALLVKLAAWTPGPIAVDINPAT